MYVYAVHFFLSNLSVQETIFDMILIIQFLFRLQIRFQPVIDDRYYPVAHTCFNLLDLPRYKTKEKLKYYLLQAIQQTHGFSLV